MAKVSIGAFRARLVLETPVETTDLAGGVTRNWTQAASLWGDVATLSASQRQEAAIGADFDASRDGAVAVAARYIDAVQERRAGFRDPGRL